MRRRLFVMMSIVVFSASLAHADDRTFGGFDCTDDCSGHKAGYDWAEQNGISDESACSGNSSSFEEGCQVFTQDPSRGSETDDDGEDIEER